jgi:two-component system sensor histidine kinase BaeS
VKFSIGHRLFLAVLLSYAALVAVGVGLVRWRLLDTSPATAPAMDWDRLADLSHAVATRYLADGRRWTFLPASPEQRKTWLREELASSTPAQVVAAVPSLGYRIGLIDANEQYLAGVIARPLIVAFASLDTLQRAIVVDGEVIGFLVVAKPESATDELAVAFLIQQQDNLLIVAAVGLLLGAISAYLLAAHFRRPIRLLVAGARRLANAQFDTRITVRRSDELGELAAAFNQLATRLEDAERSRQQWVADTSHELRTPLSVVRGQLEALLDGVRAATPENVALLLRQVLSLSKLVDELNELARSDVGQLDYHKAAQDVWPMLQETVASFAEKFRLADLKATLSTAPAHSIVLCDLERLRQVMTNLLENSVRYTSTGGRIEVQALVRDECLHVLIDDTAPGVDPTLLPRLGERFFRVDASRSRQRGGAGLGLALCRSIIAAHGGRLEFSVSPLGGLRVAMILKLEA